MRPSCQTVLQALPDGVVIGTFITTQVWVSQSGCLTSGLTAWRAASTTAMVGAPALLSLFVLWRNVPIPTRSAQLPPLAFHCAGA